MAKFEVMGSGVSYVVLRDGAEVAGPFCGINPAEEMRDSLERKSKMKERPCITCQTPFMSEGAHNRMCDPCRTGHKGADIFEGSV